MSCPEEDLDQELDDCLVGPVPIAINSFEFEGSPPDPSKIPPEDVLSVATLILTGSYNDQEFVRVGYYQNTEYDNEEMKETPPGKIAFDRLVRDISAKPRVRRFQIELFAHLMSTHNINPFRDVASPQLAHAAAGAVISVPFPSANDLDDTMDLMLLENQTAPHYHDITAILYLLHFIWSFFYWKSHDFYHRLSNPEPSDEQMTSGRYSPEKPQ